MHSDSAAKAAVSVLGFALALGITYYVVWALLGEDPTAWQAAFFGLGVALGEALLRRRRKGRASAP